MAASMLSVGIDIGTSTTSMVVSRLYVENTASCFAVPHVVITKKEIIYRGYIYQTPLLGGEKIDIDRVSKILKQEYQNAGITPDMIQTGAVIITGESSRKENAALVTEKMSNLAGDFVVATAGPDLESIIAGKGAGAQDYSKENNRCVANLDIGGGTTNIAVFDHGELTGKGCYDIGGRLIKVEDQKITYISERLLPIIRSLGIQIKVGDTADVTTIKKITDRMAAILGESIGVLPVTDLCESSKTLTSTPLVITKPVEQITFSGGVADYIYSPSDQWFKHGDIGPLLAQSIIDSQWFKSSHVLPAKETIRATVVGAGSYTTSVSGSTITFSDQNILPLKNIPVFIPSALAEQEAVEGQYETYKNEAQWFLSESGMENILFTLPRTVQPGYKEVCRLADVFFEVSKMIKNDQPLLILTESDFAKALGQAVRRRIGESRSLVCIDSVHVESGDYLDLGLPMMNGMVIPVVVKTLIFG